MQIKLFIWLFFKYVFICSNNYYLAIYLSKIIFFYWCKKSCNIMHACNCKFAFAHNSFFFFLFFSSSFFWRSCFPFTFFKVINGRTISFIVRIYFEADCNYIRYVFTYIYIDIYDECLGYQD